MKTISSEILVLNVQSYGILFRIVLGLQYYSYKKQKQKKEC